MAHAERQGHTKNALPGGVREVEGVHSKAHLCLLYRSEDEHRTALTAFTRRGLEREERVVSIVDAATAAKVRGYLREAGIDPQEAEERGQLRFLPSDAAHRVGARLTPRE